jgi:hypothetical protein
VTPDESAVLPRTETSLFSTPTLLLPDEPRPARGKKTARTPRKTRPIQPGDPACWAWAPFHFRDGLNSIESAIRALRAWHKGRCGICGEVPRLLVVDHDHQTALVRGLLCDDCNLREGVSREKDDAFARWRAVPSAALLGIAVVYASSQNGVANPMPFKVTGPPSLPEWAPPHHPWPPVSALRSDPVPGEHCRPLVSHLAGGPGAAWAALSPDQRVAVRVCAPSLAAALEAAN